MTHFALMLRTGLTRLAATRRFGFTICTRNIDWANKYLEKDAEVRELVRKGELLEREMGKRNEEAEELGGLRVDLNLNKMEQLFQQTDMDLHQVHLHMRQLEQCQNERERCATTLPNAASTNEINDQLTSLERLVVKEPPAKRRAPKYRYDQLKYDYTALERAASSLQSKLTAKWRTQAEREELLTRRFKPNETHLDFEGAELLVNDRLKHSHNAMDDLIAQGNSVLTSLREQHINLKGVKRKVLDIGQLMGLSSTTLRMIEKRLEEDWLLFLVLCVLFLIFMYCFYRYWRG